MAGSAREVKNAEEEGVKFSWLAAPKAFVGDKKLNQILVQQMRLTTHDSAGRQSVVPVEGEVFPVAADMAICALGFEAEAIPAMFAEPNLQVRKSGTIAVDKNMMTSVEGVFAAGDIVRGASLVVWAIKDGREAAERIHQYVSVKTRVDAA